MTPITRKEYYLAKLAGQDIAVPSPIDREESYLAKLCGENVDIPTPITIDEMYLAAMCGEASDVPAPVTRLQMIWAGLLTSGEPGITPITREETIWAGITLEKWETVTGYIATFTARRAAPLKRLEVAIQPVQSGSGDPSPDNVRPISGFSAVNVWRTGKNLLPKLTAGTYEGRGVKAVVDDNGVVTLSGTSTSSGNAFNIPFESDFTITQEMVNFGLYYHMNNSVANGSFAPSIESNSAVLVASLAASPKNRVGQYRNSSVGKVAQRVRVYIGNGVTLSGTYAPAFMLGESAATDYVPFTGSTTIPITIPTPPGTVYGGTLDVLTGVLTVTHGEIASYAGETIGEPWLSSMDVYAPGATPTTGAQVVYPLAEPLTYQLTGQEVSPLVGVNHIWSGAGPVTVEYRAN